MSNPNKQSQEMTMEQRLLLAFGLMISVLMVYSYLMPAPPEQKKAPAAQAKQASAQPASATPAPAAAQAKPAADAKGKAAGKLSAPARPDRIAGSALQTFLVDNGVFKVTFSNQGAAVRNWVLTAYKDSKGQPLDLVNSKAVEKYGFPMEFSYHAGQSAELLNKALYKAEQSADGLTMSFEYFDGTWRGKKTLAFARGSHVVNVASEVTVAGQPKPHLLAWRGGFGDFSVIGAAAAQATVYHDATGLTAKPTDSAEKEPQANRGAFDFAGINDAYFAAVAVPGRGEFELHTFLDKAPNHVDGKEDPFPGMALGGEASNRFQLFVGPKDTSLLPKISPKLANLIDFGWFTIVAGPLFAALKWLQAYTGNWGWAIIVATIIINFLLLPLKISSLKSMKKMGSLQPEIKKLQEKYAGMSMKDPRRQEQNQEMMALYSKHGVNPMGGCMPMALQIPFFVAFYNVLSKVIELRGAQWLWVTDLSRPESVFGDFRILPLAMLITQFIMQKMTPSTSADPQQQRIMLMMPLMFGFMFWGVSSGLVLYWLTGNVVGIAQQWFFNRLTPAAPVSAPAVTKKK